MEQTGWVYQKELEVPWGDCDPAGIVYYVNYFDWFSVGRVEFFKQIGLPYKEHFYNQGIFMLVIDARCRYKRSLEPEEKVVLETWLARLMRSRLEFQYRIKKDDGGTVAEGFTIHAYVDKQGKPFDLKKKFPLLWERLVPWSHFVK